jgi:hypothetical protein
VALTATCMILHAVASKCKLTVQMINDSNYVIDFICLFLSTPYVHKKEVKPEVVDTILNSVGQEHSVI